MTGEITTTHRYEIPLTPEAVWEQISDVRHYTSWWPWLRAFDASALLAGEEWRCTVQPPVPYLVRFRVLLDEVEAPNQIRATVSGDVVGLAELELELEPASGGCVARLQSSLAPGNAALRLISRVASPIARFGHDWVLDSGAREFIARAVVPALDD